MIASGAARTEIDIIDYSILVDTALKGKTAYLGVTERGKIGEIYDIGSWEQYEIELGSLMVNNDFPLYCKRALDAGGSLLISPAGKYADASNPSTLSGVKATYAGTQSAAAAVGSTTTFTLSSVAAIGSGGADVSIVAKVPGQSNRTIAPTVSMSTGATKATTVTAILAAINGATSITGYSATGSTTTGIFTVTGPTVLGAFGNRVKLSIVSDPELVFNTYNPVFSGGTDTTVSTGTILATALDKSTKYNDAVLVFTNAVSNDPNKYDITLSLTNSKLLPETVYDVPKLASDDAFTDKIAELVENSRILSALSFSDDYVIQPGTHNLTGGTNGTALSPTDYIGDQVAKTNMYAFDNTAEATKICIPDVADPTLAQALADYVDARKDVMGLHRTPIGITTDRVLDYRYGTGAYSHTPIDSWRNLLFSTDLKVIDPRTNLKRNISCIADVTAAIARKDKNRHEWFSFAGLERGRITNVQGLVINVGAPGSTSIADNYDKAGIIPVIQDSKKRIYIEGDNSLYLADTLLKKSNVGELLTFMFRTLKELGAPTFDPNDVETWKALYRRIQPWLEYIKDNRGIWNYKYLGDQDIMDISQAKVNKPENIDAGLYKANIGIKPKVNSKYIWFTIGVFNSGFDFTDVRFEA